MSRCSRGCSPVRSRLLPTLLLMLLAAGGCRQVIEAVPPRPDAVEVVPQSASLGLPDSFASFSARGRMFDRAGTVMLPAIWSTSDPLVASIDRSGLVRPGILDGMARISAMYDGVVGYATVSVDLPAGRPYAAAVVAYSPGPGGGLGADRLPGSVTGWPRPRNPDQPPREVSEWLALGQGGWVTLELAEAAVDGPGADLIVHSGVFVVDSEGRVAVDAAFVEVSQDGERYVRFPAWFGPDCRWSRFDPACYRGLAGVVPTDLPAGAGPAAMRDPEAGGGDRFDLAEVGLDCARFIRLIDTGSDERAPGSGSTDDAGTPIQDAGDVIDDPEGGQGFLLDAVVVIHSGRE